MRELVSPSRRSNPGLTAGKYGLIVAAIVLAMITAALGIYANLATAGIGLITVR